MKILIAGAGGYLGGRLSSFLSDEGYEVIAVCNKHIPADGVWLSKMHEVILTDVSSFDEVSKLSRIDPDVIINLVSLNQSDSNGDPDFVNQINVTPTWNLLKTFAGQKLRTYIYLSTIHVYGNQLSGDIDEKYETKPANAYGLTHLMSEQVANYFSATQGVNCYNIRYANGFGAPQFTDSKCWDLVINNLCLNAWQSRKIVLKSDGSPVRDFINIIDLLIGIKFILERAGSKIMSGVETTNFSSGENRSMVDIAMVVKEVYESRYRKVADVFINGNQKIKVHQKSSNTNYRINNSRFLRLLQGNEIHPVSYGINEIFDFLEGSTRPAL
jgi:nucleoside-diphosphate-sugar epimerase